MGDFLYSLNKKITYIKKTNNPIPIIKKAAAGEYMSVNKPIKGANTAYIILFEMLLTEMTVAL